MALVLVKEDGSGLSNANSYADASDGDSYHEGHLYATAWTTADAANKAAALVMATRMLDDYFDWQGTKISDAQALEFPRYDVKDRSGWLIPAATIPQALINATCEYARWLLISDRTADADTLGFKSLKAGSLAMEIDRSDRAATIPSVVNAMGID
jgi:hypothetical protein